jgi:hypothetical protein
MSEDTRVGAEPLSGASRSQTPGSHDPRGRIVARLEVNKRHQQQETRPDAGGVALPDWATAGLGESAAGEPTTALRVGRSVVELVMVIER